MFYLALLIIAIWVNWANKGALFLSLVIGASAFACIPLGYIEDRNTWFLIVFFADLYIIYIAFWSGCIARIPIMGLSVMLCTGHLIDWKYQTDPIYYQIANWLEYMEIVSCIIFSHVALNFIRKRVRYAN